MEVDPSKIEQWLVGHSHELHSNKIDLHQLRSDAQKYNQLLTTASKKTFSQWLRIFRD